VAVKKTARSVKNENEGFIFVFGLDLEKVEGRRYKVEGGEGSG
jgi:hypothetical protein